MKLLIATGVYPPDIGGPATYTLTIAEEFFRLGHAVTVVAYSDAIIRSFHRVSNPAENPKHFKEVFVPRGRFKGLRHFAYFLKVFWHGRGADVIFAQDSVSAGFPAMLAAKILGKKFVLKVVGDYAWEQGVNRFGIRDLLDEFLKKRYGIRVWFFRKVQRTVARAAYRVIVPSRYLKSVVMAWGISGVKTSVIYNAVFIPKAFVGYEFARKDLKLSGRVLISAGRLVPWKGFSTLVEVMSEIVKKYSDAKLFIIGEGPEEGKLKSQITNYKLQDNVFLLGRLPRANVLLYLAAADLFVLNTGYEGFSHQLLEVLTLGVPVITTLSGGNKELVEGKKNVICVGYNDKEGWFDAISSFLSDEQNIVGRYRPTPLEISVEFSKDKMISETLKLLVNE